MEAKMEIKSEQSIFINQVFNVKKLHVKDQNGEEVVDYLVVEPKIHDENLVSGVAILPLVDGMVGCVNMYRPALKKNSIEIPHGFIEKSESAAGACSRELREETGIVMDPEKFIHLCTVAPDGGVIRGLVELYFVDAHNPRVKKTAELGLGDLNFFSIQQIDKMIQDGELVDSFTMVAFLSALSRGLIQF
jgi:8-oxo-dGTP pyrophosphatase MutT (NUDIX family)